MTLESKDNVINLKSVFLRVTRTPCSFLQQQKSDNNSNLAVKIKGHKIYNLSYGMLRVLLIIFGLMMFIFVTMVAYYVKITTKV